ncbi:unnamed protein product, partial [Rotaria sp. Silwood1]
MPELYKLYQFEDGPELLTYAATILDDNVLKSEQQLYSQAYSQANKGKVLLTPPFSRFMNALRKLHNDVELKMQKSTIVVEPIIMNTGSSGCDISWVVCQAAKAVKVEKMIISVNDNGRWTLKSESTFKNTAYEFTPGIEFHEIRVDAAEVK